MCEPVFGFHVSDAQKHTQRVNRRCRFWWSFMANTLNMLDTRVVGIMKGWIAPLRSRTRRMRCRSSTRINGGVYENMPGAKCESTETTFSFRESQPPYKAS